MKLSIGKAWEETSAFMGREARLLAPVALATFALPAILAGWASPGGNTANGSGLLTVAVLLAMLVGQMTIILLVNGWRGSIGEAMGTAIRRLPVLVGSLVIVFLPLMLIGGMALGAVLIGSGISDPAAIGPQALAKIPGVAWIVLLLVLGAVFLGVRMFQASAVAVSEKLGPVALIRRSWSLTRGSFWRLLALFLLLTLIGLVVNLVITMVVGSVATLAAGEPRPFNTPALLIALATGLAGAVVSTISAMMVGRVYAQLVAPQATVPNS